MRARRGAARLAALVAWMCALELAACDGDDGRVGPSQPGEDVLALGRVTAYQLDVDPIAGRVTTRAFVTLARGGNCYRLASLELPADVRWDGATARRVSHADGVVEVCGEAVAVAEVVIEGTITAHDAGAGEVGLRRRTFRGGETATSFLAWIEGCDRFALCEPRSDALVDVTIALHHTADVSAICPGELAATPTQTRCVMRQAPTYVAFTWVAAEARAWTRTELATTAGGVRLVLLGPADGALAQAFADVDAVGFVDALAMSIAPFPWGDELRFATTPMGWRGFEPPAQILLQDGIEDLQVPDYVNLAQHTILHEVAHQWAGVRTTMSAPADIMWKEAAAEYLAWRWEDERLAPAIGAASARFFDSAGTLASVYPVPLDDPAPDLAVLTNEAYGLGTMALFVQMEALIGRAAVGDALAEFLAEPGHRATADLKDAFESASGADLDAYFAAWVVGRGEPERPAFDADVERIPGGSEVRVTVTQDASVSATVFPCVVEVELVGSATRVLVSVRFGLAPTSREASATVAFDDEVLEITIDPRHRVMSWR